MMVTRVDTVLDLNGAARVLFDVPSPTTQHLNHVRSLLMRGMLPRGPKGGWTTTMSAVTNLLAKRALRGRAREDATPSAMAGQALEGIRFAHRQELPPLYRDLLRQYFGAVLLQRRASRGTCFFQRAVLGGQLVLIAMVLCLVVGAISPAFAPRPQEQVLVEQFIAEEYERYEIIEWIPLEGTAAKHRLRVKFRYYSPSRKPIETDRIYAVNGTQVALDTDD